MESKKTSGFVKTGTIPKNSNWSNNKKNTIFSQLKTKSIMTAKTALLFFLCFMARSAMAQQPALDLRIGLIADPQYADKDDRGTRFYRGSLPKLDAAVRALNQEAVDLTLVVGDMVDEGMKSIAPVMWRLGKLDKPVRVLLGNHDYVDPEDPDGVYRLFGMPAPYYTVEKGKWVFILLNTNEISPYAAPPGTENHSAWESMRDRLKAEGRKNVQPWNGGIGGKQMRWMEREIQKAAAGSKNVIIFTHHPLFPENGLEALNNREILAVIEKHPNVRAVISGHHHEGNFGTYKGIPMVTLEGMVETPDENAYGILELCEGELRIKGQGRMTSRTFRF